MNDAVLAGMLFLLSTAAAAVAHPGHDQNESPRSDHAVQPLRDWTVVPSGETVRGAFLASRGDFCSIEREDGGIVVLALDKLGPEDRAEAERQADLARNLNAGVEPPNAGELVPGGAGAPQAAPFALFAPFVRTHSDDRWLYVESDGLPHAPAAHPLMVGIRSWQQQVPLPQRYVGENAWRIPLHPELAETPVWGKTRLRRGAIALAVNGVPIFNALNNRGDDAFKAGELDEFGGHSGRADDYHYHVAPLALQKVVGADKPIAFALDGFPIYGLFEPGAGVGAPGACPLAGRDRLDEFNGHHGLDGTYHYHASRDYPYINGGVRGKVSVIDDQIEPQPHATPVRQWLTPLRGASITGFKELGENAWSLEFSLDGAKHRVDYRIVDGKYLFDFVGPGESTRTESYTPRPQRDRPAREPRREQVAPRPAAAAGVFALTSPGVGEDARLPVEYACDGAGVSPPLAWTRAPAGVRSYAVTMHHIPGPARPGDPPWADRHVYLVLYNIPAGVESLEKATRGVGDWGVNTVNRRAQYAPPCSKGPGPKVYTVTVYALSSEADLRPQVEPGAAGPTMSAVLEAIQGKTLATAELDLVYDRPPGPDRRPPEKQR